MWTLSTIARMCGRCPLRSRDDAGERRRESVPAQGTAPPRCRPVRARRGRPRAGAVGRPGRGRAARGDAHGRRGPQHRLPAFRGPRCAARRGPRRGDRSARGTHGRWDERGPRGAAHTDRCPPPAPSGRPCLSRVRPHRTGPLRHRVRAPRSPWRPADRRRSGTARPSSGGPRQPRQAGILGSARRPNIEYPIWASVHGLAVLLRGPLRSLPERDKMRLEDQVLAFVAAAVS